MTRSIRLTGLVLLLGGLALLPTSSALAQPKPKAPDRRAAHWNIDDVKAGMKGQGKTVVKGVKIETFDAEIIGVLKNTSPGRDLVLARLSGLNLDKTGVIAGMSGSPVFIQGKLLGAVAYAWAFGKEPIAGITPFSQMQQFAAVYERRDLAGEKGVPKQELGNEKRRVGLASPIFLDGRAYQNVTVSPDHREPQAASADGLWMVPLKTPVMTSGMSARSLALLRDSFSQFGLVPMQGGGVGGNIPAEERNIPLEAGGALSVAMITGDFDMSGIGTVTHIDGKRVYGFGHPFMGIGGCDLPLMTGYTHTIMPRLSLSFKMGSPLRMVGVINADVSTCIAGWLDRQPDMLPMSMAILREPEGRTNSYNVKVARMRSMLGQLVHAALTNSVDMEGNFPEEMSAHVKARVEIDGREPLVLDDWFAGQNFTGDRAAQMIYAPLGMLVQQLNNNPFETLRIKNIECATEVQPGRRTADIETCELESDTLAPGEMLKAWVTLRTYKGAKQRIALEIKLPADLADGNYTALIGDELNNARAELRDNPQWGSPQNLDHFMQALQLQLAAKRTTLVMRVPLYGGAGVAINGKTLPNLPASMVQMLSSPRRTNTQTIQSALVARAPTTAVVQGADSLRFQVAKNKRN